MKAFQITEPGKTALTEIDRPAFGGEELLLRVKRVGFCGSDLSTYLGKNPLVAYPRIPGHEIGAVIAERGARVPEEFAPGRPVTLIPYTACGSCTACRRGRPNACRYNQTLGVQRDGGMCEYIAVPWRAIAPDYGLKEELLPMVEPLTVGFHAVDRAAVTDADSVVVIGCGMIGIGAIVRGVIRGARVIVIDIDDGKLATAGKMGAAAVINSRSEDAQAAVNALTGGSGADVVIEAVGSPATYRLAVELAAFCGRLACIGYAKEEAPLPTKLIVQKELDLRGSRNAAYLDFQAASAYLAEGSFPLEQVISRRIPMDEAGRALADWAENPGGVTKIIVEI